MAPNAMRKVWVECGPGHGNNLTFWRRVTNWTRSSRETGATRVTACADLDHRPEAVTSRSLWMQVIARQTQHAGQVILTITNGTATNA
jgi:hypothetical protein